MRAIMPQGGGIANSQLCIAAQLASFAHSPNGSESQEVSGKRSERETAPEENPATCRS